MNATQLWQGPMDPNYSDERKWSIIRSYRNELLTHYDWTQLPDAVLTVDEKHAWAAYRQALRDIPENFTSPDEVEFPTPPGSEQ